MSEGRTCAGSEMSKATPGISQAVAETLQHRGHPEAPGRKLHHDRLGGGEAIDIGFEPGPVRGNVVIAPPRLFGEHGIEQFGVEVEQIDLVAGRLEPLESRRADRAVEALPERMAIDVKNAHAGCFRVGAGWSKQRIMARIAPWRESRLHRSRAITTRRTQAGRRRIPAHAPDG